MNPNRVPQNPAEHLPPRGMHCDDCGKDFTVDDWYETGQCPHCDGENLTKEPTR